MQLFFFSDFLSITCTARAAPLPTSASVSCCRHADALHKRTPPPSLFHCRVKLRHKSIMSAAYKRFFPDPIACSPQSRRPWPLGSAAWCRPHGTQSAAGSEEQGCATACAHVGAVIARGRKTFLQRLRPETL